MLLFAGNVVEQGSGVDSLVTKKMYPKIIGMRKKFTQFGWFAAAIQFYKVLNETSQLSLYMESDSILIYQLSSKIKETCFNFQEFSEEYYEYLPSNVEIIDEDSENDLIVITPISNSAENNEEFQLTGVADGKGKVDKIRQDLLSVIQDNITERFEKILKDESLDAMKLFHVNEWGPPDVESCVERDAKFIQFLYERFKSYLDVYEFNLAAAKREWKRVRAA